MTEIVLSLVSHTNVGKTTLARTLLRRDVGVVLDQAHVTEKAETFELISTGDDVLRLADTPGFGDSRRLLARLRREGDPVRWFLGQVWDRIRDRPFWSSQRAVLHVREEADVVLYLVSAAEEPADAGYLEPELELLSWVGRPIVVLLNQTGEAGFHPERAAERVEAWRAAVARFPAVGDVLVLDAFARCWVEEGELLRRLEAVLPADDRPAMRRLVEAWERRSLEVLARALTAMAAYLEAAGADRETLPDRRPKAVDKRRAMRLLTARLEASTQDLIAALLAGHGLSGRTAGEVRREIDAYVVQGTVELEPERGALLGGVVSGALGGLAADVLSGGLTFGGGLVAGAILGALGGAGLARGFELATAGRVPAVSWSPAFLDRLAVDTVLRYLAIAHYGRGRGELDDRAFAPERHVERWRGRAMAAWRADEAGNKALWSRLERTGPEASGSAAHEALRADLERRVGAVVREVLKAEYPASSRFLGGSARSP